MERYNHKKIEPKWQKQWEQEKLYETRDKEEGKEKCYVLDMFPYPSGDGLHVGHPKGYIATDIFSRYKQMKGFNILHPMGWDAFGLPAENYAIENKVHPKTAVDKNVTRFKEQLSKIGFNYDWSREINTTDPDYYKWTQWIFLQLFKKGLAYESNEPINWCPSCKTGLANEDLEGGRCERCGSVVEQKPLRQWVLKITDYADRMLEDLDDLDWPDSIKTLQRNWIGRSEGAEIIFPVKNCDCNIDVFTTRPDTLYGATYMVVAPEHSLIHDLESRIENLSEVKAYVEDAAKKDEIERTAEGREKTGVELKGIVAINPTNKKEIPVWVADYVLGHYGTGAIMAVPAHDERDFAFAEKYNLPIVEVISGGSEKLYVGEGTLINSGEFDGTRTEEARTTITKSVGGEMTTTYKLRDWVFSRQRYWGEPIPIIHCEKCGPVAVPEEQLPVVLPEVDHYEPTGTGESPLAGIEEWVNVECPECEGPGKREANTMPQWAGSSWYYLRYIDPDNDKLLVDSDKEKYWSPVDMYVGGAEHATRHLIYARFWHKFLFDIGSVNYPEPFKKLQHVGLIQAEDGRKMSKRWGNVINPDDVIENLGADTLRMYEMFMGPFDHAVAWSTDGAVGVRKFLEKVWKVVSEKITEDTNAESVRILHKTVQKIGIDIENFRFNTSISQLMICTNTLEKNGISKGDLALFVKVLAPFAPHVAEEIWREVLGNKTSVHLEAWPKYDESLVKDDEVVIGVQINGKVRGEVTVTADSDEESVKKDALALNKVQKHLAGEEPEKVIYVPGKIVNIVVKG